MLRVCHPCCFSPTLLDIGWGIGGVLVDRWSGYVGYFESRVPSDVVQVWQGAGAEQIISQAEAYAALVCYFTWHSRLNHRRIIHFIDNSAAESAFVALSSRSPSMDDCVRCLAKKLDDLDVLTWFCRCPSASNPADAPSRGKMSSGELWMKDAHLSEPTFPDLICFVKPVMTMRRQVSLGV